MGQPPEPEKREQLAKRSEERSETLLSRIERKLAELATDVEREFEGYDYDAEELPDEDEGKDRHP